MAILELVDQSDVSTIARRRKLIERRALVELKKEKKTKDKKARAKKTIEKQEEKAKEIKKREKKAPKEKKKKKK